MLGLYIFLLFSTPIAFAHGGLDHIGKPWWKLWNLDLLIIFNLSVLFVLYSFGWWRMKIKNTWRLVSFLAGFTALLAALISPIDPLSDLLGSAHMLQHSLLMMVAAPLLVVGTPGHVILWTLSSSLGRRFLSIKRLISLRPLLAWILYSLTLWIWHIPYLYEAALKISWVHDLQHLAVFTTAFGLWSVLFDPFSRTQLDAGAGVLYLFVASLHSMILGVLMALSPSPWYESYIQTAPIYGLSALEDQQLAGLIMWMPAGIAYVAAAAALLIKIISVSKTVTES